MAKKNNQMNGRLPYPYQEVEYIESTGTQYIDTNIAGWTRLIATFDVAFPNVSSVEYYWFGSKDVSSLGTNKFNYSGVFPNLDGFVLQLEKFMQAGVKDTNRHIHVMNSITKTYSVDSDIVDGSGLTWYTDAQATGFPFRLFQRAGYNRVNNVRMYGCVFNKNGLDILNLVPCYDITDPTKHTAGLYDIVNNQFYGNSGTGYFIVGEDVIYEWTISYETEHDIEHKPADKVVEDGYQLTAEDLPELHEQGYNFLGWYYKEEINE